MTKVMMLLFFSMTASAAYMTWNDVNVQDPSIKKYSVRQGSNHQGFRGSGGYYGGK